MVILMKSVILTLDDVEKVETRIIRVLLGLANCPRFFTPHARIAVRQAGHHLQPASRRTTDC